jgi:hypothetical protein
MFHFGINDSFLDKCVVFELKCNAFTCSLRIYLAPGRFEVAVSNGMPRKATSRSPSNLGGSTIGTRINEAIPPALCKSFGCTGSEIFFLQTTVVETLRQTDTIG